MEIIVYVPPGLEHEPSLLVREFKKLPEVRAVSACALKEEVASVLRHSAGQKVHMVIGGCITTGRNFVSSDPVWALLRAEKQVARPIIVFDYLESGHNRHDKSMVLELEVANVPVDMRKKVKFRHLNSYEQLASDIVDEFCRRG